MKYSTPFWASYNSTQPLHTSYAIRKAAGSAQEHQQHMICGCDKADGQPRCMGRCMTVARSLSTLPWHSAWPHDAQPKAHYRNPLLQTGQQLQHLSSRTYRSQRRCSPVCSLRRQDI
jgi:hypothetical protein